MAASLKNRFGEDVEIEPGKTGQFDVIAEGTLIFSKSEVRRFPDDGEVEDRFAMLKAGTALPPLEERPGIITRTFARLFG